MAGWRFAPRLVPTLAAFAMIALTLSLGRWQVNRAGEKQARQAEFEVRSAQAPLVLGREIPGAGEIAFRRVVAAGSYRPEGQVFIDNRHDRGRAGFHVITPLQFEGGVVLINRGWVARTAGYPRAPDVAVPAGPVRVTGLATIPSTRFVELSGDTVTGNAWQNLSLAKYRERTGLEVLPAVILASPTEAGLVPVEEKPDAGIAKHQEYALTWFALATTLAALWVGLNLKRVP